MAWSPIKTFVDALVLTGAELNTYLSDNTDWLKNGIDWMGASDAGDGSRTAQQARTAMIGADFMTPVNATPVDLAPTDNDQNATGITIPSSGQVLALSAETTNNLYALRVILRADLVTTTTRTAGQSPSGKRIQLAVQSGSLYLQRTTANELLIARSASAVGDIDQVTLWRL